MKTQRTSVVTAALRIHTLGRCEVRLHGRVIPLETWRDPKDLELLLALVTLGGQQIPKAELVGLLWSDEGEATGVTRWYAALHRLQAALGRPEHTSSRFITMVGGRLSLHATECWSDVWAFERAIRQARRLEVYGQRAAARECLEEANALCRGEYLPGFPGQAWLDSKRHAVYLQRILVGRQLSMG